MDADGNSILIPADTNYEEWSKKYLTNDTKNGIIKEKETKNKEVKNVESKKEKALKNIKSKYTNGFIKNQDIQDAK